MKGKVPCGSSQLTRLTCWEDRELAFKGSTLELHWVLAGGRGAGILGRQAFREGWEKYGMFEGLDSANPGQRRTQRNILDRGQILESPVCCVGLGGQCPGLQEASARPLPSGARASRGLVQPPLELRWRSYSYTDVPVSRYSRQCVPRAGPRLASSAIPHPGS